MGYAYQLVHGKYVYIAHYPPLQESQVYLVTNWVLNLSFWIQNKDAWIFNDAEQALVP